MSVPFTKEEMEEAIKTLNSRTSPGPDNITNEMLMHLGKAAKRKLLKILNSSWKMGKVPQAWKISTMIPIHKEGKPQNKPSSYRPVSLTSCICKLMERMINVRLTWFLEQRKIYMDEQTGFRRHRSTEDQICFTSQEIEDASQEKKQLVVVWVDMAQAFDRVWKDGLLLKLKREKISNNMYKWIESFLTNRNARVALQGKSSRIAPLKHGVPQGGVLSPTLFLLYMND